MFKNHYLSKTVEVLTATGFFVLGLIFAVVGNIDELLVLAGLLVVDKHFLLIFRN